MFQYVENFLARSNTSTHFTTTNTIEDINSSQHEHNFQHVVIVKNEPTTY